MNDVSGIPQYPWDEGDTVFASALNAAIANIQVRVSDTPPIPAVDNTLWWDSSGTGLYIRYNDGNSTQWVVAQNQNTGGEGAVINVLNHGAKGDGTTDDNTAIQNVLNTYAGKATVFVPDTGNSYVCNNLNIPSGTDLLLNGTIKSEANAPIHLINLSGSNVTIRGHGTLDANGANQTGGVACINGTCNYLLITGITLQNSSTWNLNITGSTHVWVDKVTMLNGTHTNEFAAGCSDCWLTGCYIDGVSNDIAFSFYGGVTNSGAIGNIVTNAGLGDGINVLNDGAQTAPCSNITIADNICYNNDGSGIQVNIGSGGVGTHTGIIITGNRCSGNNRGNYATASEIAVQSVNGVIISDNLVSSIDAHASAYGIWLGSAVTDASVTGNSVFNTGSSTRPGIGLYVNSSNIVNATGNTFHDYRSPQYMSGIGGAAGSANAYTGNLFGRLTATISLSSIQPDTAIFNTSGHGFSFGQALPTNAANDAAAATAGVPVGGVYRAGSVLQVRVV